MLFSLSVVEFLKLCGNILLPKGVKQVTGTEIKARIVEAGLKNYVVAKAYGLTETSFSRKLRKSFSEADTEKVLRIIDELKTKG